MIKPPLLLPIPATWYSICCTYVEQWHKGNAISKQATVMHGDVVLLTRHVGRCLNPPPFSLHLYSHGSEHAKHIITGNWDGIFQAMENITQFRRLSVVKWEIRQDRVRGWMAIVVVINRRWWRIIGEIPCRRWVVSRRWEWSCLRRRRCGGCSCAGRWRITRIRARVVGHGHGQNGSEE